MRSRTGAKPDGQAEAELDRLLAASDPLRHDRGRTEFLFRPMADLREAVLETPPRHRPVGLWLGRSMSAAKDWSSRLLGGLGTGGAAAAAAGAGVLVVVLGVAAVLVGVPGVPGRLGVASGGSDEREVVVAEILADVPVPAGFDVRAVVVGLQEPQDRYQAGAHVTGAVACAWIEQWDSGRRAGDESAVAEAVTAMGTARDWQVLQDMTETGDYPETVWAYADVLGGATDVFAGGDGPLTQDNLTERSRGSLGCDGA